MSRTVRVRKLIAFAVLALLVYAGLEWLALQRLLLPSWAWAILRLSLLILVGLAFSRALWRWWEQRSSTLSRSLDRLARGRYKAAVPRDLETLDPLVIENLRAANQAAQEQQQKYKNAHAEASRALASLNTLFQLSELIETDESDEHILQRAAELLPRISTRPGQCWARIQHEYAQYTSRQFDPEGPCLRVPLKEGEKSVGQIELWMPTYRGDRDRAFSSETRRGVEEFAVILGRALDRRHAAARLSELNENLESAVIKRSREVVEREAKLSAILASLPDYLFIFDSSYRYREVHVPKDRVPYVGIEPDKLKWRKLTEILPADVAEIFTQNIDETLASGEVQLAEFELESIDKGTRCYEGRFTPLGDVGNDTVMLLARDVTDQRELIQSREDQEQRFRALVRNVPGVVLRVDFSNYEESRIIYTSEQIDEITGIPADAYLSGQALLSESVSQEDMRRLDYASEKLIRQGAGTMEEEFTILRADGEKRNVIFRAQPVIEEDGNARYLDCVLVDMTDLRRSELARRESESMFRAVFDHAGVGIAEIDLGGHIISANDAVAELLGTSHERLIGRLPEVFAHPEDTTELARVLSSIREGQDDRVEVQLRMMHSGDVTRWVSMRAVQRLPDEDNSNVVMILTDITDRKRAEITLRDTHRELHQQKQQLQAILDHSTTIIFVKDTDLRYVLVNKQWQKVCGFSQYDVLGKRDEQIWPDANESSGGYRNNDLRVLETGEPIEVEENVELEGSKMTFLVSKFPLRDEDGNIWAVCGIATDITERKEAEERLEEVGILAQQASDAKSDFLANMSHEIRTPMNAIIGMTDLALNTDLSLTQKRYLDNVKNASRSLLGIINDILDFSKIEAGKLEFEQRDFELDRMLAELASVVGLQAQEKDLELLFSIPPDLPVRLTGDPLRLGQVLTNLVNNAIKFTEEGEVIVAADCMRREDGKAHIRFRVRDTGIGIPQDKLDHLFDSFAQADSSTTRRFGGTGLGLTIARQLVNGMGGELEVESTEGQGTLFEFTLPLEVQKAAERELDQHSLVGARVLLVDDNDSALFIHGEILEAMGFRVDTAASAAEALKLVSAMPADEAYKAAVIDWSMPETDGLELATRIRSDLESSAPAIVMISARGVEHLHEDAIRRGFRYWIAKPATPSDLLDAIVDAVFEERPSGLSALDEAEPVEVPQLKGLRVLLVEDNEINQELATALLLEADVDVKLAADGQEAVDILQQQPVDLVLMDMQMPVLDGLEATSIIREDPRLKDLPIIALTANAMAGDRQRCLEAGMNDYLPKPIEPEKLYAILQEWDLRTRKPEDVIAANSSEEAPTAEAEERDNDELVRKLASVPDLDVERGLSHTQRNKSLYLKLVRRYRDDYQAEIDKLQAFMQASDAEGARRWAHSLKAVTATIGALDLSSSASELERAFEESERPKDHARMAAAVVRSMNSLGLAIRSVWQPSRPVPQAASLSANDLERLEEKLAEQLRHSDTAATDTLDRLLNGSGAEEGRKKAYRQVHGLVEKYLFDEALAQFEQIAAESRDESGTTSVTE